MELTIAERLSLLQVLPQQGNLGTLKMVRELQGDLSLSDAEIVALEYRQDGDLARWSRDKEQELGAKDLEFSRPRLRLIRQTLHQLEKQGRLSMQLLSLYEREFAGEENEDEEDG